MRANKLWYVGASSFDVSFEATGNYLRAFAHDAGSDTFIVLPIETSLEDAIIDILTDGIEHWGIPDTIECEDFIASDDVRKFCAANGIWIQTKGMVAA